LRDRYSVESVHHISRDQPRLALLRLIADVCILESISVRIGRLLRRSRSAMVSFAIDPWQELHSAMIC